MTTNQGPDARKAVAMARTRLTDEQLEPFIDSSSYTVDILVMKSEGDASQSGRDCADAQQDADYELLWPLVEAALEVGETPTFSALKKLEAALYALGLEPEGESDVL